MPTPSLMRCVAVVLSLSSLVARAEDSRALNFTEHGFSMNALEGKTETANQQVVIMLMPSGQKFTPNVNVQVQPFEGTLDDYMKLSHEQFKTMGIKMISETPGKGFVAMEYSATQQGIAMHWYARAVQGKKKIYLVTSTSAEDQWKGAAAALKKCVDSFKLTP